VTLAKAVMADTLKAIGQDMEQKAAHERGGRERHELDARTFARAVGWLALPQAEEASWNCLSALSQCGRQDEEGHAAGRVKPISAPRCLESLAIVLSVSAAASNRRA
jgi:hypothetical protein